MISTLKALKFTNGLYRVLRASKALHDGGIELEELKQETEKFRRLIESLGPTYIKFGQILSVRYDLFPAAACEELQVLLDHIGGKLPLKYVRDYLKEHLDEKSLKLIGEIDPEPLGVASLGQVHKAYLTTGEAVAIKIQKPNVHRDLKTDLSAIKRAVRLLEIIPPAADLELSKFIQEFEFWTLRELDYLLEAHNIELFAKQLEEDEQVSVSKVFWKLTNDKVLTTRYVDGVSGREFLKAFKDNYPDEEVKVGRYVIRKRVMIELFARNVFNQIFKYGLVHGDPHPSNVFVTGDNKITLIDFGIVGKFSKSQIHLLKETIIALNSGDSQRILQATLLLDQEKGVKDAAKLEDKIKELSSRFEASSGEEYSMTRFFLDLLYQGGRLGVQFPRFFIMLGKVIATYDGMMQAMEPTANLLNELKPMIEEEMVSEAGKRFSPKKIGAEAYEMIDSLVRLAKEAPEEALALLKEVREDGIPVRVVSEAAKEREQTERYKAKLRFVLILTLSLLLVTVGLFCLVFR